MTGIVCGSSECPICARTTEVLFGPCVDCTEHFDRHGSYKGIRRRREPSDG